MTLLASEITPTLREVSWALHKQAKKLRDLIANDRYKLTVRMSIEDRIEQETAQIPNNTIVYHGMQRIPKKDSLQEETDSEELVNDARKRINESVQATLSELNEQVMPARLEFNDELRPVRNTIGQIVQMFQSNPELFNSPLIFKEEAEALADIFSVLALEAVHLISLSVSGCPHRSITIVDEPYARMYERMTRGFRKLTRICPPLEHG